MASVALEEKASATAIERADGTDLPVDQKSLAAEAAAAGQGVSGYETLTIWETAKKFKFNIFVCTMMAVSAAADGYQIGYVPHHPIFPPSDQSSAVADDDSSPSMVGNIIANPGFVDQFATGVNAEGERFLASSVISAWNAIGSCGQFVGMVTLPFLSGRWGRKFAMFWLWSNLVISIILECVAKEWRVWLVAKLFGGIGVGCLQSTIPTYISEIAPVRIRGALLMCYNLWWITGQFFAPVALQAMSTSAPRNYLTPVYSQWGLIGLMLIIYVLVPESPAWAASVGKEERAKKALRFLHWDVKDYDVDHQYHLLVLNTEHEKAIALEQKREKWYAIFRGRDGFRTLVSCWTLMTQQFIGLGLFFGYASYFFQQIGFEDPFKITCITSGINIFFSVVSIWAADYIGRRVMACSGTTLCWTCCVVVGILGVAPDSSATDYILILFTVFWSESTAHQPPFIHTPY